MKSNRNLAADIDQPLITAIPTSLTKTSVECEFEFNLPNFNVLSEYSRMELFLSPLSVELEKFEIDILGKGIFKIKILFTTRCLKKIVIFVNQKKLSGP